MKKWQLLFIGIVAVLFIVAYFTTDKRTDFNNNTEKQKEEIVPEANEVQFERIGGLYDEVKLLNYIEGDYIFVARENDEEFIVRNGIKISESLENISDFEVYGDSYAFVTGGYAADSNSGQWLVHFKDKKFGPYDFYPPPNLVVSPEEPKRLIYILDNGWDPESVIFDGTKKIPYDHSVHGNYSSSNHNAKRIYTDDEYSLGGQTFKINKKIARVYGMWDNAFGIKYDGKVVSVPHPVNDKTTGYPGFYGAHEINNRFLFLGSIYIDDEMIKTKSGVFAEPESNQ